MQVKAQGKYLKLSPQKARKLVKSLKRKKAVEALEELNNFPHKSAFLISKVLQSAIANAENNFNLKKDDLLVNQIIINEGPSYKRIKPRARGGRDIIKKRTSHITVILVSSDSLSHKKTEEEIIKKVVEEKEKEVKKIEKKKVAKTITPVKKEKKEKRAKPKTEKTKEQITPQETKKIIEKKEKEKEIVKEKRPFFQRFFRRKGGM